MDWKDALDKLPAAYDIARVRYLCSDANPDAEAREAWRPKVVRLANGDSPPLFAAQFRAGAEPIRPMTTIAAPRRPCCGNDIMADIYGADP